MTRRNISKPGETISLKLSTEERQLLLDLTFVEDGVLDPIRRTPGDEADVQLSLEKLDSLAGSVAADANHTSDKTRKAKLARIYEKIDLVLNAHPEDKSAAEPEAVRLAQLAASILVLADDYAEADIVGSNSISRTQNVELRLAKPERAVVLRLPTLKNSVKGKLDVAPSGARTFQLTLNDLAVIGFAVAEALLQEGEGLDTERLMSVAGKATLVLVGCLNENAAPVGIR
jgi:hypothetical protein